MKGGVIKRSHDVSVRMIVQDLFLVDKMQRHHPQYELILSSNASSILTEPSPESNLNEFDDVFMYEGEFLLNILFNQYSCLSCNYPARCISSDGADIRTLLIQCTAINAIGMLFDYSVHVNTVVRLSRK